MVQVVPVLSDLQTPYEDKRAVSAVATWISDILPDKVACVGDVLDAPQISRWTKGRAGEHAGDLAKDRDHAVEVLRDLRVTDLSRSNHDDRLSKYISENAPGLAGLPELEIEEFMGLNDLGITFHKKPHAVAPGWLLMHGDEGTLSRVAGMTALGLARRTGRSVSCGHTHRAALTNDNLGFGGKITAQRWGLEVGHLMDVKKAGYMKAGITNWQQSVGALVIDGRDVYPFLLPIVNGKLHWEGKVYRG
jgi:hypothetical protein